MSIWLNHSTNPVKCRTGGSTAGDTVDDISERSNERWRHSVLDTHSGGWTGCSSSTRWRWRTLNCVWWMCLGTRSLSVRNRGKARNRLPACMVGLQFTLEIRMKSIVDDVTKTSCCIVNCSQFFVCLASTTHFKVTWQHILAIPYSTVKLFVWNDVTLRC